MATIAAAVIPAAAKEVLDIGTALIDRLWPDKEKQAEQRAAAAQHVQDLAQERWKALLEASSAADAGQVEIDKLEAQSDSLLKSGWRPAIGWVGAVALFTYYVPYCIVATVIWAHQCWVTGTLVARPDLGIMDLIALVSSMLGTATLRSLDKWKNVA
jgi:Holin of 3TMs, for gene-transfer release